MALLAVLLWVLGREASLRWLATELSGAELSVDDARGSLYGPMRFAYLRYETPQWRVSIEDVALDWRWQRGVEISVAQAARVHFEWRGAERADAPPPARTTTGLPFAIRVPAARVAQVDISAAGNRYRVADVRARFAATRSGELDAEVQALGTQLRLTLHRDAAPGPMRIVLAARTFDLAAMDPGGGRLPSSALTGEIEIDMTAAAPTQATLKWALRDSSINRARVTSAGHATAVAGEWTQADGHAQVGDNRISVAGTRAAGLHWRVRAPRLAQIGAGFAGNARADGEWRELPARRLRFDAHARGVRIPGGYAIAALNAQAELGVAPADPFSLQVRIDDARIGTRRVRSARVDLSGTRARHRLRGHAQYLDDTLGVELQGGWDADAWHGRVNELRADGAHTVRLARPAELTVHRDGGFDVRDASLRVGSGRIEVARAQRRGARWQSNGRVESLALADMQPWLPADWPLHSTLVVGGRWQFVADAHVDGELLLWRERGDLRLRSNAAIRLGLERLDLRATVARNRVHAQLHGRGQTLGDIAGEFNAGLSRHAGFWRIAPDSAFSLSARAEVPSIAWFALFTPLPFQLDGSLRADVRAGGPWQKPEWHGTVSGADWSLAWPQQGLRWRQGTMQAQLDGAHARLIRLHLQADDGGSVNVVGEMDIATQSGQARVSAKQLSLMQTATRTLIATGDARIDLRGRDVRIDGAMKLDRGRIELPDDDGPTLSEDIVIVGQESATRGDGGRWPRIALDIDLGEHFFLKGRGLDVQLGGRLRVHGGDLARLDANGQIYTVRGTYAAYGQRLQVERGILTFSGPLDNPGLNILALRKNQAVHAGVAVTGTALVPIVKLVSVPDVPDGDKLSWLVLGHGIEQTDKKEVDLLNQAAAALLAQGESVSLQAKLARYVGVDELRFSGAGGLQQAMVTVGKQISSALYLTFEQGLTGTSNLIKLRYTLSPRWALQTQTGSGDTAIDLVFTIAFD